MMKNKLFLFLLSSIFFATPKVSSGRTGGYVGNGGDVILCQPSAENPLNGTYSLDYVLTLSSAETDHDNVAVTSWEESANRISSLLQEKAPSLRPYFEEFRQAVLNQDDTTLSYIWNPSPFGLLDIQDELLSGLPPSNCYTQTQDLPSLQQRKPAIFQTVIREFKTFSGSRGQTVFRYHPESIELLKSQRPLQFSYLMVHEWLWGFGPNVERNRRINHFLHSKQIEQMTPDEVGLSLRKMGLALPDSSPLEQFSTTCEGKPLSSTEIYSRFKQSELTHILGPLQILSRSRTVECPDADGSCSSIVWREGNPLFSSHTENKKYVATVSWGHGTSARPIRIVSPELLRADGILYQHGMSQISCRVLDQSPFNLSCSIEDYRFLSPLTGLSSPQFPDYKTMEPLKGILTENCLQIRSDFFLSVPYMSRSQAFEIKDEVQVLLDARFSWRP